MDGKILRLANEDGMVVGSVASIVADARETAVCELVSLPMCSREERAGHARREGVVC